MTDAPNTHVALVTGAGNGLGEVIAGALHARGIRVGLADIDGAAAATAAERLDPSGQNVMPIALDVRERRGFTDALDRLVSRWGRVQILVNNAAITMAKPVLDITSEEFDDVMAVNLRGTFQACQVFGTHFRDHGYGRIINMASVAGQNGGTATGAHYAASKAGIIALTKVFARDLGKFGITVNAVAPGPLDLPMVHRTVSPEKLSELRQAIPVGDIGDPHFVGRMVAELASPAAAFVTGATWDVNGGLFMR